MKKITQIRRWKLTITNVLIMAMEDRYIFLHIRSIAYRYRFYAFGSLRIGIDSSIGQKYMRTNHFISRVCGIDFTYPIFSNVQRPFHKIFSSDFKFYFCSAVSFWCHRLYLHTFPICLYVLCIKSSRSCICPSHYVTVHVNIPWTLNYENVMKIFASKI